MATIKTKFNTGELVVFINRDRVTALNVKDILSKNETITYSFIESEAISLMDKPTIIFREEKECFKSIDELAEFYKELLKLR